MDKSLLSEILPTVSDSAVFLGDLHQVSTASVVYFELQAHEKGAARMLLYENSKCQVGIGGGGWKGSV